MKRLLLFNSNHPAERKGGKGNAWKFGVLFSVSSSLCNSPLPSQERSYSTSNEIIPYFHPNLRPFVVAFLNSLKLNGNHLPFTAGFTLVLPTVSKTFTPNLEITYCLPKAHPSIDLELVSTGMLSGFLDDLEGYFLEYNTSKMYYTRTIFLPNLASFARIFRRTPYFKKGLEEPYKISEMTTLDKKLVGFEVFYEGKLLYCCRDPFSTLPASIWEESLKFGLYLEDTSYNLSIEPREMAPKDAMIKPLCARLRLIAGVMRQVQSIYWNLRRIDISEIVKK